MVDFKMYSFIYDINDFDKLNSIIADCKKKQRKILNDKWKSLYKERCTKYYVELEELVKGLDAYNHCYNIITHLTLISDWVYSNSFNSSSIYYILQFLKEHDLLLTKEIKLMACEACACQGCEYIKEHLGYTCKECKENYYTGYEGYCDE